MPQRAELADKYGQPIDATNPLPIVGDITIDTSALALETTAVLAKDALVSIRDSTATASVAQDTATVRNGATSLTPKFAAISSTGSGDTLALVASKKIRVLSMFFIVAAATTVKFQTGATTDLTGAMSYAANDGISLPFNPVGWFETTAGAKLNHVLGTSVGFAGGFTYIEV